MNDKVIRRLFFLALLVLCVFPSTVVAQMAIGGVLPDLPLELINGESTSTHALVGNQGGAFVFWSNDCNWTSQYENRIESLDRAGLPIILVNSNDLTVFPKEADSGKPYKVAYVRDIEGGLAKTLGAERTPHAFVFDSKQQLAYRGGIDDSPADAQIVQSHWLRDVMNQLSNGQSVSIASTKSFGCRIKLP